MRTTLWYEWSTFLGKPHWNLTSENNEEIKLEAECDAELESDNLNLDEITNSII